MNSKIHCRPRDRTIFRRSKRGIDGTRDLDDPAHLAAARSKKAIEDLVTEIATLAGAENPRELSQELCLVMEGVYVTRHVTGNPETIEIARRIAERIIAEHLQVG